jgi:hypothetical protein
LAFVPAFGEAGAGKLGSEGKKALLLLNKKKQKSFDLPEAKAMAESQTAVWGIFCRSRERLLFSKMNRFVPSEG